MLDDRITDSRATTPFGRNLPGPIEAAEISEESLARQHEVHDIQLRPIVNFALVMIIAMTLAFVAVWWLVRVWTGANLVVQPQIAPVIITPQPASDPTMPLFAVNELDGLLGEQSQRLNSYGWVDREAGVVHMPVERAMQLFVERGVPARSDAPAPTFGLNQAYELESEGGQMRIPPTREGQNGEGQAVEGAEDGQ